jgi:hypothetical protein
MCPIDDKGWEIQTENGLIIHQSGFKAEYRGTCVYSIKHFPYEATIHDIRNWVKQAEHLLVRRKQGNAEPRRPA